MWMEQDGINVFAGKIEDEALAVKSAKECGEFKEDVEDELVSDEAITCLNCRYRRWLTVGFSCEK